MGAKQSSRQRTINNETIVQVLSQYASDIEFYKLKVDKFVNLLKRNEAKAKRKGRVAPTALMIACENGRDCIVEILLKCKRQFCISLDLDAVNDHGETASMIARRREDTKIVALFMRDKFLTSVENGDEQTVKTLLEKSLDDFKKGVCLKREFVHQDKHMTLALQAKLPSESFVNESWCLEALYIACDKSRTYIAHLILDYFLIVSSAASSDQPLLHRILREKQPNLYKYEDVHLVDLLMDTGKININATDDRGVSTLKLFCELCSSELYCSGDHHTPASNEILLTLLRYNTNVNQKDHEGRTALMTASEKGCVPVVRTMLSWASENNNKLDLDAKDRRGQTALMKAALWKHPEVLQMLIKAGASVNLLDNWDFTALHLAFYEVASHRSWIISGDISNTSGNFTDMYLFNSNKPHKIYGRDRRSLNVDKSKSFILLLEAEDLDMQWRTHHVDDWPTKNVRVCTMTFFKQTKIVKWLSYIVNSELLSIVHQIFRFLLSLIFPLIPLSTLGNLWNFLKNSFHSPPPRISGFATVDMSLTNCDNDLLLDLALDIDSKIPRPYYDKHGIGILHRLAFGEINKDEPFFVSFALHRDDSFTNLVTHMKWKISECSNVFREKLASQKDLRGRTALHCAVNYAIFDGPKTDMEIIEMLTSFGCSINERDNNGRTPLHYAKTEYMSAALKNLGAKSQTDEFGNSDEACLKLEQHKICNRLPDLLQELENLFRAMFRDVAQLCVPIQFIHFRADMKFDTEMKPKSITELEFLLLRPFCKQNNNLVMEEINAFVEKLAVQIEKQDPRFGVQIVHSGSSYEETKIDFPDEFDFCFILTKFSELCEVCPSPELLAGFVHLKLRDDKKEIAQKKGFHSFFKENGFIYLEKVNIRFRILLKRVLSDLTFIESVPDYDWIWFLHSYIFQHMTLDLHLVTTLKLTKLNLKPLHGVEINDIAIDIVPCIQIDGWWPAEGISVSDDVKRFGCILVFDWPQRNYPMVPYSESCARVSFAPAESEMIKQSGDFAKKAYMIAKHLTQKFLRKSKRDTYLLKTSLLYCIGAFHPALDRAKSSGLISPELQLDTQFWLESLFRCYLDFHLQDSCPSYFMPSFSLSVIGYTNTHHYSEGLQRIKYFEHPDVQLFLLCRYLSENKYYRCFEFHGSNPDSEKFNREELMTKLLNSALSKIGIKSDGGSDSNYANRDCPLCSNN